MSIVNLVKNNIIRNGQMQNHYTALHSQKKTNPVVQLVKFEQGYDNLDIVTKGNPLEHNFYTPKCGFEQE